MTRVQDEASLEALLAEIKQLQAELGAMPNPCDIADPVLRSNTYLRLSIIGLEMAARAKAASHVARKLADARRGEEGQQP